MSQTVIYTNEVAERLTEILDGIDPVGVFVIADSNTEPIARRLIDRVERLSADKLVVIPAGDDRKTVESLAAVWEAMSRGGVTRRWAAVNVGGGMVTDLGGFAAATFKRGIPFVNVPTTLLGAVDAAVGGKTGINFCGLKNEVGCFREAEAVVISTDFFRTLPRAELLSGYAEMLKHALLKGDKALQRALAFDFDHVDYDQLLPLLEESVEVKRGVVAEDPLEKGLRKALNLGHTAAHAFEALAMDRGGRPVAHGHAVAWGLVVALTLSHIRLEFPTARLRAVAGFVERNYPKPDITCDDYPRLLEFMAHDKKNADPEHIAFTLLRNPGDIALGQVVAADQIEIALDLTRDLLKV